jgi:hypothetical protein
MKKKRISLTLHQWLRTGGKLVVAALVCFVFVGCERINTPRSTEVWTRTADGAESRVTMIGYQPGNTDASATATEYGEGSATLNRDKSDAYGLARYLAEAAKQYYATSPP